MTDKQFPGSYFVKGTPTLDSTIPPAESDVEDQLDWRVAGPRAPGYERQIRGNDGKVYNLRFCSLIINQRSLTVGNLDNAFSGPANEFFQAGIPLNELERNLDSQTTFANDQSLEVRTTEFLLLGFVLTESSKAQQHDFDSFDYVGIQPFIRETQINIGGTTTTHRSWWSRALAMGHNSPHEDAGWHSLYFTAEARGHTLRLRYAELDREVIRFSWTVS